MEIERLTEQNPWWADPAAIRADRHLIQAQAASFVWAPPFVKEFDPAAPVVCTLRGPRQVGKTTTIKLLIKNLLHAGGQWPRILYYSLDLERDPEAIVDVVQQAKAFFPKETGRWCIFLDEVSSVPDWQRGIKYLRDQTSASDDCFVLTGSSASDIRRGAERLPGRRGPGSRLNRILLPLSFRDFCDVQGIPGVQSPPLGLKELSQGKSHDVIHETMRYLPDLGRALDAYAQVGGFPRAIDEYLKNGRVSSETVRILWDVLAGDIDRAALDRLVALALLDRTVRSSGSPISWRGLAEEMGVGSADTAQRYAAILSEAFALLVVHFWDRGRSHIATRKNKKLYPVDPLVGQIPHVVQPGGPQMPSGPKIESIVGVSVYRAEEPEPVEGFSQPRAVFYWRSNQGREVDFLSGVSKGKIPIEVKFKSSISGRDRLVIRNSFGEGVILSNRELDLDHPVRTVPAAIFLWLLRLAT
jgi:predicted AAA+ superfamily ATPase